MPKWVSQPGGDDDLEEHTEGEHYRRLLSNSKLLANIESHLSYLPERQIYIWLAPAYPSLFADVSS